MKKHIILLVLFFPVFAFSQNWNLFNINQKSYYAKIENNITIAETFKPDSLIEESGRVVLYFNRKIGLSEECYNNIIGYIYEWSAEKNPDLIDSLVYIGDSILYITDYQLTQKDTFLFLTNIEPGESWFTTENNILITCTGKTVQDVFGIEDSVKIFNIHTDLYDDVEFILSKSFGLIKFIPFWKFTYPSTIYNFELFYNLIGYITENEKIGYVQPEFKDYFHLHQGDKLFWKYYSFYWDSQYTWVESTEYYIDSLIYSFLSEDSVFYSINRKVYSENGVLINNHEFSRIYTNKDYGNFFNAPTSFLCYSHKDSYSDYSEVYNTNTLKVNFNDTDTSSSFSYIFNGFLLDTTNCSNSEVFDWCYSERFSTNVGLFNQSTFFYDGNSDLSIRGSIIDGIIYGNTTIPTEIDKIENFDFNIYPNPTTGIIKIDAEFEIKNIKIFDILGKLIIETAEKEIDLSSYSKGIYLVKIETQDKIKTYKILLD
jgi:hypothetical protein